MIRVLQCVNNMHRAGLETMLMNYYRNIDQTQIQFDFLTHRPFRSDYDDEIESLGGKVYYAPRLYPQNYPEYFSYMDEFFKKHPEYKIVHSHIDSMSYLPLLAAKKAGVPVRIAHSHSTRIDKDFKYPLKCFFRSRLTNVATHCFACGNDAGKFLFGNHDFTVIPNAIDSKKYLFNEELRKQKREQLGITDKFVVANVGRFEKAKNQQFLISIMPQLIKQRANTVLMLVGDGKCLDDNIKLAKKYGVLDKVIFLGKRQDLEELYQAMDVFVMPSLFEGVPLVGIEAQFASLPCIFSQNVPKEVSITNNTDFIPLSEKIWIEKILNVPETREKILTNSDSLYDIKNSYIYLMNEYKRLGASL